MFFSPFTIAITSFGEERASLGAFRTFVQFALVWFCLFPLPLSVWEGLRFVIVSKVNDKYYQMIDRSYQMIDRSYKILLYKCSSLHDKTNPLISYTLRSHIF